MYDPNPHLAGPVLRRLDAEAESKDRTRRPGQSAYTRHILGVRKRIGTLIERAADAALASQASEMAALAGTGIDAIHEGHVGAGVLGRQRAGDYADRMASDELWAARAMAEDEPRWRAFMEQIKNGDSRYVNGDGSLRQEQIQNRANLYTQRMRGTANEAFTAASKEDDLYDWVMLNSEHCPRCPEIEAGSPYTRATLPSHPGDGSTPCRVHCGCVLVRYDGVIGFTRVFDPKPTIEPGEVPDRDAPPADDGDFFAP